MPDFSKRLGAHLRRLRKQKGLSLLEVEAASGKEFKASVLGAYERGERAISAGRLARLAELYRLPLQAMLPPGDGPAAAGAAPSAVAIDLNRLQDVRSPETDALGQFVRRLQPQRGEWGGPVLTIRADDVRVLAWSLDRTPEEFVRRLEELGVRAY